MGRRAGGGGAGEDEEDQECLIDRALFSVFYFSSPHKGKGSRVRREAWTATPRELVERRGGGGG